MHFLHPLGTLMSMNKNVVLVWIAGILIVTAAIQYSFGRLWVYENGPVKLWTGNVNGGENSQQISDPYTFSHVLHGFGFYGLLTLVPRPLSLGARLVIATAAEAGWEVWENSEFIINRYRAATAAQGYTGDTILNSIFDILACIFGFFFASRYRWQTTLALTVVIELLMLALIRDNLTLNIVMLIYPIDAIRMWQLGL